MKAICALLAACLAACATPARQGPYGERAGVVRNELRAAKLVEEATAVAVSDPARSEELLRDALDADLFNAKAHNNLGVLLLQRGELYLAATEFEWARKLLPGHPEPRVNLALTLERAGQHESARQSYLSALEVYPGYIAATQGAARMAVIDGDSTPELESWLAQIAVEGETEVWRAWAAKELARTRMGED
ncbi:MAG: tetratricopeptide repeat protein [Planctomycetota bacterium]